MKHYPEYLKIGITKAGALNGRAANAELGTTLFSSCKDQEICGKLGRDLTRADAYLREQYLMNFFENDRTIIEDLASRKWGGFTETFFAPESKSEYNYVDYSSSSSSNRNKNMARAAERLFNPRVGNIISKGISFYSRANQELGRKKLEEIKTPFREIFLKKFRKELLDTFSMNRQDLLKLIRPLLSTEEDRTLYEKRALEINRYFDRYIS